VAWSVSRLQVSRLVGVAMGVSQQNPKCYFKIIYSFTMTFKMAALKYELHHYNRPTCLFYMTANLLIYIYNDPLL